MYEEGTHTPRIVSTLINNYTDISVLYDKSRNQKGHG